MTNFIGGYPIFKVLMQDQATGKSRDFVIAAPDFIKAAEVAEKVGKLEHEDVEIISRISFSSLIYKEEGEK